MTIADPLLMSDFEPQTVDHDSGIEDLTQIQEFYKNSNIFITGATGFLGKILIEKLLRSCSQLSTIYILVRNKKGKNVSTRIEEIFEDVIFGRLKKEFPKFRHKVVGVAGDCSLPDLGMSPQDRAILEEQVNIVFHVAATVRFDEKLSTAVAINIRASRDMLSLAQKMPKLKSYIHVSTAYANCIENVVEEKIYPPAMDYKKLIVMAETLPDKIVDDATPKLLDNFPNTYAYTKQIAEDLVRDMGKNLPVGITRPAIVVSTYREPVRAWINNMYGPTGVVAGAGVGLLRVLHCDKNSKSNIVPVDLCVNSMITAAWDVSERFLEARGDGKSPEVPVYNFDSNSSSPITWDFFMDQAYLYGIDSPSVRAIWYFTFIMTSNIVLFNILTFLLHTIPALIVDGALICVGKKPKMLKVYARIHKFAKVLSYFATRSWTFKSENVQAVCRKMSDRDNEIFFSDMKKIEWQQFFVSYVKGIRIFLINDPIETLPEAKIKWRRLYWAHQTTKAVLGFLLLRILWSLFWLVCRFIF